MGIWVGIDIAKEVHWATGIDDRGQVVLDQPVANDPDAIQALLRSLSALADQPVIGLDLLGGSPPCSRSCSARPGCGWSMCPGWRSTGPARPPAAASTERSPRRPGDRRAGPHPQRLAPAAPPGRAAGPAAPGGRAAPRPGREQTRRLVRLHDLAGEQLAAGLVRELAGEALACRTRLAELEADLARLLASIPTPR
jgi:Transposase